MVNLRSALGFSACVLAGVLATFAVGSLSSTTSIMMVLFALVVATVLIAIGTRVLRRAGTIIRSLTWGQILLLLVLVSGLVFRERSTQNTETNPLDAWAFFRIGLMSIVAIILLVRLSLRQSQWLQYLYRGLISVLGAYSLICIASCLWSVYPAWTFYKSLEFFIDVAVLAAVVETAVSAKRCQELFDWTWLLQGVLLASVWLGLILWPHDALTYNIGVLPQLSGVMPDVNSNSVGELGAIVGAVAFCRLLLSRTKKSNRFGYTVLLLLGLLTMSLAQARSAILGFAVAIILILLFSGRFALCAFLAGAGALLLSFGSTWETFFDFMRRGETPAEMYKLSSRVDWWSLALPKILERPFTGWGAFAGGRFFVMAEYKMNAGLHSDWVEILVGTGVCGFVLALIVLLGTWRQLIKSIRASSVATLERQLAIEAIGALAVVSIRSIFTTDLFYHPPIVFFVVVSYAEFLRSRQKQESRSLVGAQLARIPAH